MNTIIRFLSICSIAFLLSSCKSYKTTIKYILLNNSDNHVEFILPYKHLKWHSQTDLTAIEASDTNFQQWVYIPHIRALSVDPYSSWTYYSGYSSITEMVPIDTLRVFVCRYTNMSRYLEHLVLSDKEYYVRYDFAFSDIESNYYRNNSLRIVFPPDTTMKDIKMWPPYETFAK